MHQTIPVKQIQTTLKPDSEMLTNQENTKNQTILRKPAVWQIYQKEKKKKAVGEKISGVRVILLKAPPKLGAWEEKLDYHQLLRFYSWHKY